MAAKPPPAAPVAGTPVILVVDDEPQLIELVGDVIGRELPCRLIAARDLREAQRHINQTSLDLLLADLHLPDGDGMTLLSHLQDRQPLAGAVVITGKPTITNTIGALRGGAYDFLPKPFTAEQLVDRVRRALDRQARHARASKRLARLKSAVRQLNLSRRVVTQKVDLLCNDLVAAYGELSRQLDDVRTQENFRKTLEQAKDLEQMLCHAMDWLLRAVGYANVAVWLSADDKRFDLGAYMKYTIQGTTELTNAMRDGVVQRVIREGCVVIDARNLRAQLSPGEYELLRQQMIVGVNCSYLGESLGVIVLFRDHRTTFKDQDIATIRAIGPVFATMLASIVRKTGEEDPALADEDDRRDAADWWKRGETPPF